MSKVLRDDILPPGYAPPDPRDKGKVVRRLDPDEAEIEQAAREFISMKEIAKALAKEGSLLECIDAIRALDDAPHRNDRYRPSPFVLARLRADPYLLKVFEERAKNSPILAEICKAATSEAR